MTVTGTPFSAALPDRSSRSGSVRSLIETPGDLGGVAQPGAVDLVAVAVGEGDHTPASCPRRADLDHDRAHPRRHRDPAPVVEARGAQVVGVHQQLVAGAASRQPSELCIQGVVVLLVPAADEQQPVGGGRRQPGPQRPRSPRSGAGARSIRLPWSAADSGMVGRSGPRSTPSGWARSRRIDTLRPGASSPAIWDGRGSREPRPLRQPPAQRRPPVQPGAHPVRELAEDLPVVARVRGLGKTAGVKRAVLRTASPWKTRS